MKINAYSIHSNFNNFKNNTPTFGWKEHSFETIYDNKPTKKIQSKEEIEYLKKAFELDNIIKSIDAIEFHGKEAPAHLYEAYRKLKNELNSF